MFPPMVKLILIEIVLLAIHWRIAYGVPGTKSIKQCHKYYNLELSLTNLNLFRPMTSEDLGWIRNQDNNETAPLWASKPVKASENGFSIAAVGGEDALDWEFPFMAALGFGDANDIQYDCGGSLISEEYIVTAAHCIFSGEREPVKYIRLGNVKIKPTDNSNFDSVQTIKVSKYFVHPNYTFAQRYNDIALIKLARPVEFTSFIKPICLEYERKPLRNKVLYAAGWGLLGHGEDRSNHLQKVTLRQYARNNCQKTYASDRKLPNGVVDNHQICAGSVTAANITDTCEGDSGGPLLYEGSRFESSVKYLTGVISFGVPCGIAALPAIYTRVAYYIDWIERIVWPECHKFYDLKSSLRNLDYFKPMTSNDLKWIREQENNETIPTWVDNPFEDILHNNPGGIYQAVGGENVFDWEYPFMAALGFGDADDIEYNCGGSLISEEYILTAAHCIFSVQREPVKYVRLGNVKIKPGTNESIEVQEIGVSAYHMHPNYTFSERYNDIALIKLAKPATFTKFVKPICLEYERKSLRYKKLFAAGWGLLGYGEDRSNHLQKVTLRQHTLKSCQKTYSNDRKLPNGIVDDHQICAGTLIAANITDTCEGDSGGPLLYQAKRFEWTVKYLTGIISFGVPCGLAPLPAIYTRVAYYIDWIEGIVWPNLTE